MTSRLRMSPVAQTAGLALLIGSALAVSGKATVADEGAGRPSTLPARPQSLPPRVPVVPGATGRPAPPLPPPGTLRVIQYNVQFLCPLDGNIGPICGVIAGKHWPNTQERARAIGEKLACFDIIGLEETINSDRRREMQTEMERLAPHCGRPSRLSGGRYFDGEAGPTDDSDPVRRTVDNEVTLFSRLPILERHEHLYRNKCGDDASAAKGVVHTRLDGRGRSGRRTPIDVFVTHLQAGGRGCENAALVRRRQVDELVTFMRAHRSPSGPILVLGDFNIDGAQPVRDCRDSNYSYLSRQLGRLGLRDVGMSLGGTNMERLLRPEPTPNSDQLCQAGWRRPERIDYIFVGPASVQASGSRVADSDFIRNAPSLRGTYSRESAQDALSAWNRLPYAGFPFAGCEPQPASAPSWSCGFLTFSDHAPVVTTITIP